MGTLLWGAPGFFKPRMPPPIFMPAGNPGNLELLRHRAAEGDCSSAWSISTASTPRQTRFSVGAVNVTTGNFAYFDNTTHKIGPEHVMASGSLPPGFPATEIDGEYLLGRRPRFQHAAAMGARRPAAPGHAGLPGRSVERARRAAARPDRGRHCARRTSAFRAAPAPAPTSSSKMQALRRAAAKLLARDARRAAADAARPSCWRRKPTTRSTTSST